MQWTKTEWTVVLVALGVIVGVGLVMGDRVRSVSVAEEMAMAREADRALTQVVDPVIKGVITIAGDQVSVNGSIDEKALGQVLTSFRDAQYQVATLQQSEKSYRFATWTLGVVAAVLTILVFAVLYPRLRATLHINKDLRLQLEGARTPCK